MAHRAQATAQREAERARREADKAASAAARATVAEQREAQKMTDRMHAKSRLAEVEAMNADLTERYAEIDGLLAATLDVDDHVDLESLKVVVEHP